MTTHEQPFTSAEEDEIKLAILENDPEVTAGVIERLWNTINERLMRSLATHHFGLSPHEQADIAYDSVAQYCRLFPSKMAWETKPIYTQVARIAFYAGRDRYKKFAKHCERHDDVMAEEVAEKLKDTDCGAAWGAIDAETRARIGQAIRRAAVAMPKRQRQIANAFAQTWDKEYCEKEAIEFIYKQTGEKLSHDQYKRGWAEVRKKLKEPIDRLLREEGYARQ